MLTSSSLASSTYSFHLRMASLRLQPFAILSPWPIVSLTYNCLLLLIKVGLSRGHSATFAAGSGY